MVSTRQQIESMTAFLPVTFLNLDVDDQDFLYATSQYDSGMSSLVKRLNPGGNDVLHNKSGQDILGDRGNIYVGRRTGNSVFRDVCYLGSGLYVCADATRGRLFTYSGDGELLFAFGGLGDQVGNLSAPSGLDNDGYRLLVTDLTAGRVTVFEPTDYGRSLLTGASGLYDGDYEAAEAAFHRALAYNTNSEAAYLGIGKVQLRAGQYADALASFSLASNRTYYSKALGFLRRDFLNANFTWIFLGIALLAAALAGWMLVRRRALAGGPREPAQPKSRAGRASYRFMESFDFAFTCLFHPFGGFSDLKREKKGSAPAATAILALYILSMILRASLQGFLFRSGTAEDANPLFEGVKALAPVLLFCIINWCITTLMDGKGSFRDIYTAVGYALLPMVLVQAPLVLLSNLLTLEEAGIYYTITIIAVGYTLFLLLAGNMAAHDFTMGKTVAMALLTVLGMAIVLFLLFLFFNLGFEVTGFFSEIGRELRFR